VKIDEEDYLAHYGILRKSGRYPWGSGGNIAVTGNTVPQRSRSLLDIVNDLKNKGVSEADIAAGFGLTGPSLRDLKSVARAELKLDDIAMANRLKFDKGMSNVAIAERMFGDPKKESTVRGLLAPGAAERVSILKNTADMLRNEVDTRGFIDVGRGVENHFDLASTKLSSAVGLLEDEGYKVINVQQPQVAGGPNNKTYTKVLAPPGTTYKDVAANLDKIHSIATKTEDGGRTWIKFQEPISVNPKRIEVKYAEDGGDALDGVIYVRPGAKDLSLNGSHYAQVRIKVSDTHYAKGMALYKDDLPPGVDLQINTNKKKGTPLLGPKDNSVLKPLKDDPDLPFGSIVDQITDSNGKVKSAMNLVNDEGTWDTWSNTLSAQMLSKQSPTLARSQLNNTFKQKQNDLDEIMNLTNPAVKKRLLEDFADDADASAVHLKAASLPRQRTQVILPVNDLKPTEIYAPNFNHGERVALIRYPHGGTFEIPELVVNNNNRKAKSLLGNAPDAIGIHSEVAKRLSGADFDGDTVLVIPNNSGKIKSTPALEKLKNFDPQRDYKLPEGTEWKGNTQKLMGDVSNLITDMTIRRAKTDEIARAVKHSMVVIDAEKHGLDHKRSARDQGIAALKEKYQGGPRAGASTLISRKKREISVPELRPRRASEGEGTNRGPVDRETGKKVLVPTGKTKSDGTLLKKRYRELDLVDDAHALSSGTLMEKLYADHSNRLKELANSARKEAVNTKLPPRDTQASKIYDAEVKSLNSKLSIALRNSPRERSAQRIADARMKEKQAANPDMTKEEYKKLSYRALEEARTSVGAKKVPVEITPREWEAIQAGAISPTKLGRILTNSDIDKVKQLATPKKNKVMSAAKLAQAKAMLANGYTQAQVAAALGVGLTTLKKEIGGG
jgi:hypothetical protein